MSNNCLDQDGADASSLGSNTDTELLAERHGDVHVTGHGFSHEPDALLKDGVITESTWDATVGLYPEELLEFLKARRAKKALAYTKQRLRAF